MYDPQQQVGYVEIPVFLLLSALLLLVECSNAELENYMNIVLMRQNILVLVLMHNTYSKDISFLNAFPDVLPFPQHVLFTSIQ